MKGIAKKKPKNYKLKILKKNEDDPNRLNEKGMEGHAKTLIKLSAHMVQGKPNLASEPEYFSQDQKQA